ncbi:MAG: hypothetical protein ACODAU_09110 [Myxococcota bacterium]
MDRERLHRWLAAGHRTWRWRHATDPDAYEAVETTDGGLAWYRWSHRAADGGRRDTETQSYQDFEAHGPLREAPGSVVGELRDWIAAHRSR